jgi:DNA-binding MarR family transcriptional regulator
MANNEGAIPSFIDLEDHLPYLANRVASAIAELFSEDLAAYDLTVPMWRVIAVLADKGEQRLVDLADLTSIEASTLSRLTEAMRRQRLISRVRSRHNKRELVIRISPYGLELAAALAPVATAHQTEMTRGLTRTEIAITKRALRLMSERLLLMNKCADSPRLPRRSTAA